MSIQRATMENKYIVSNDFYIKDNIKSFLLYFDYFLSQGLLLTKYFSNANIRRLAFILLRTAIILLYISKIYRLRYKIVSLNENALVIFSGPGIWRSIIKLIERDGKLLIQKKVFNRRIYLKEKKFYNTYKNNPSNIKLPKHTFLKKNIIEVEFIEAKTFQRSIVDGTFDFNTSIWHYKKIKREIKKLYRNEDALIHGDLGLGNIFIKNSKYYLIDFTDSCVNKLNYDLYVLLYSILYYNYFNQTEKIAKPSYKGISVLGLIETNIKGLEDLEKKFISYNQKRFSYAY